MDGSEFIEGLDRDLEGVFSRLGEHETLESESEGRVEVPTLLRLALKSELEASELAGFWLATTPEIDGKRLLAEQCRDEMKHYDLIVERLEELGEEVDDLDPLGEGYSPLYQYLKTLRTSVERIAAGPYAREAIARVRNDQFIEFCRSVGDEGTARLYEEVIQPEEVKHHDLGREFLAVHCTTLPLQEAATAATRNTLAIADELRTLTEKMTGAGPIPAS